MEAPDVCVTDVDEKGLKGQEKSLEEQRWDIVIDASGGTKWTEKDCKGKMSSVVIVLFKIALLLGVLYVFVCSLGMLGDAFQLLGGKTAGEAFRQQSILQNPVADLMMGVLVTVLLQSSSTTTSIVVTMVGAEILPLKPAIFIIMGANIGTSVTNTIVSMGQAYDPDEFRRAFAGATVHDMFNWLAVVILFPIEWISSSVGKWGAEECGMLCQLSAKIVDSASGGKQDSPDFLKKITKPMLKKIVQIDKNVIKEIAQNPNISARDVSLLKTYKCKIDLPMAVSVNNSCTLQYFEDPGHPCGFVFEDLAKSGWVDWEIGLCLLFIALAILLISLVLVVKLLTSMLRGPSARIVQKVVNSKIPKPFTWLTGYLAIIVGMGLTMLLQSSSIFTSTMTPLVGSGILHLKRMYPLTLGANIGTTFTAILASLANSGTKFQNSMQVALCHLFFNIIGIIIWYPVPAMRRVPIYLAKGLGNTTANHRWFAIFYILVAFLGVPAAIFGLSLAGWRVLVAVLVPCLAIAIAIIIINIMQRKCSERLPPKIRNWDFIKRCCTRCCPKCATKKKDGVSEEASPAYEAEDTVIEGYDNKAYGQGQENGLHTQL